MATNDTKFIDHLLEIVNIKSQLSHKHTFAKTNKTTIVGSNKQGSVEQGRRILYFDLVVHRSKKPRNEGHTLETDTEHTCRCTLTLLLVNAVEGYGNL